MNSLGASVYYRQLRDKENEMNKSTKEMAAQIRKELKVRFPTYKFSVRKEGFSGGSAITVALMTAPHEVFAAEQNERYHLSSYAFKYAQLNEYQLNHTSRNDNYDSNGTRLTKRAFNMLVDLVQYLDSLKWFDTRYSFLHLEIGKWDKPFTVK